jgi:hypothetical protein
MTARDSTISFEISVPPAHDAARSRNVETPDPKSATNQEFIIQTYLRQRSLFYVVKRMIYCLGSDTEHHQRPILKLRSQFCDMRYPKPQHQLHALVDVAEEIILDRGFFPTVKRLRLKHSARFSMTLKKNSDANILQEYQWH